MEKYAEMIAELVKKGTIIQLIQLPEPIFNIAIEKIRRQHLEVMGYRFLDQDHPGYCENCEG